MDMQYFIVGVILAVLSMAAFLLVHDFVEQRRLRRLQEKMKLVEQHANLLRQPHYQSVVNKVMADLMEGKK